MFFILSFQYFSQEFFKIILRLVYYNKINGKMRRKKGNSKQKIFLQVKLHKIIKERSDL